MRFFGTVGLVAAFVGPSPVYQQAPSRASTSFPAYAPTAPMGAAVPQYEYVQYVPEQKRSRSSAPIAFAGGAAAAALALSLKRSNKPTMNLEEPLPWNWGLGGFFGDLYLVQLTVFVVGAVYFLG